MKPSLFFIYQLYRPNKGTQVFYSWIVDIPGKKKKDRRKSYVRKKPCRMQLALRVDFDWLRRTSCANDTYLLSVQGCPIGRFGADCCSRTDFLSSTTRKTEDVLCFQDRERMNKMKAAFLSLIFSLAFIFLFPDLLLPFQDRTKVQFRAQKQKRKEVGVCKKNIVQRRDDGRLNLKLQRR